MNFSSFVHTGTEQLSRLQTTYLSYIWLFCMNKGILQWDPPVKVHAGALQQAAQEALKAVCAWQLQEWLQHLCQSTVQG